MLKQRLITALILIPPVVWAVLALPSEVFALIFAAPVLLGAWEWAGLSDVSGRWERISYVVFMILVLGLCAYAIGRPPSVLGLMVLAVLWWLYVGIRLIFSRAGDVAPATKNRGRLLRVGATGVVVLAPAWTAFVALHASDSHGPAFVLFLLVLIWGADIGAYFCGRSLGRRKLAPHISPGKTWEGVWGGLLTVAVIAVGGGLFFGISAAQLVLFVVICLVTAVFSISGDLLVSFFKRQKGVKDSGQLLPGHGGILDRIDSITAAAPVFLLGLLLMRLQP